MPLVIIIEVRDILWTTDGRFQHHVVLTKGEAIRHLVFNIKANFDIEFKTSTRGRISLLVRR